MQEKRRHQKHFSLDEARGELTRVHAMASRIVELNRSLVQRGWDVRRHRYFGGRGPNGDGTFPAELETLVELLREFERRGIIAKDLDNGLFDFPHLRPGGEEVYLCWKLGENDIAYWHGLDEGFAGRKRVEDL
jgi:hypothetical protein